MYTKKILSVCAATIITAAATFAQSADTDPGVVINGATWATRNVDAPGTFAESPQAAGMFYQWNKNIGWSATGDLVNSNGGSEWDATTPDGDTWEAANDPSPAGWRVPTFAELQTLLDATKVSSEWKNQSGIDGYLFTDKATGKMLFLPAAGYRNSDGALNYAGTDGFYWSSTQSETDSAYNLLFGSGWAESGTNVKFGGNFVRSVADESAGIANVQADNRLQVFVNNGVLTITSTNPSKGGDVNKVTITDLSGRTVLNYKLRITKQRSAVANYGDATINVSGLPQGVYLVRVGDKTAKFIKQ